MQYFFKNIFYVSFNYISNKAKSRNYVVRNVEPYYSHFFGQNEIVRLDILIKYVPI